VLVGFGTHRGTVIASDLWGGPVRRIAVPPARPDSVEGLLHDAVPDGDSLFIFGHHGGSTWSGEVRGHRAIGVVYRPQRERFGNYVPTILHRRYDAFIHCDHSTALNPLHQFEHARALS
jgi:erythromycin esterase-like protein